MNDVLADHELDTDVEHVPPADAFSLLGNETRIRILQALWAAPTPQVPFSELFRSTDLADSAQFNYHLQQLTDHFAERHEDGYRLRRAGEAVVQAVLAGSFNSHPYRVLSIDDGGTRYSVRLEAVYDDGMVAIACPECRHGHDEYPFPPGGLIDRTDGEVLEAFDHRVCHLHCLAKDGVCPECGGRTSTTIETTGECCLGSSLRAEYVL